MIKYGLISEVDARCLEKTMDLICQEFEDIRIDVTEIGIYSGKTGNGMERYLKSKGKVPYMTGIDNCKDKEPIRFQYHRTIVGDSGEMAYKLPDNSQHLIFIDGCHCFAHVISDFFSYESKVKWGGYLAFHDTSRHIKVFKDFQHGDPSNIDAYISVRKALQAIGMLDRGHSPLQADGIFLEDWELVFDEADPNDEAGGICVFKKEKA